jgi:hypothetical protein
MPEPIALCLEDLDNPRHAGRYMTCVAVRGGEPGLGIDLDGKIAWRVRDAYACELWVSGDDQLILLRPAGAPVVHVSRAGRGLEAPFEKPVVLLDQDCVETAGRRFRVHVHGTTPDVVAPAPFTQSHTVGKLAATIAMGVAAISCHKGGENSSKPVEVREQPPAAPMMPPPDASSVDASQGADSGRDGGDASDAGKVDSGRTVRTIEIRPHPPKPVSTKP